MRKGKVRALAAVLTLAFALTALTGCGGNGGGGAAGDGTLRVGVRDDIVGFGYLNEDTGKYYGLEIDIAEELAERIGYGDVEFVSVLPETRKDMLLDGEVDCLIACYSISETRIENFDFSLPYYSDKATIMVENSSLITDVKQLRGKIIGVMDGSNTGPQLIQRFEEWGLITADPVWEEDDGALYEDGLHIKTMPSYADMSTALEEGTVDAIALDGSLTQTYLNDERSLIEADLMLQEYGVATQKGSELSKQVAEAMQGMIDEGVIAELVDKWN